MEDGDEPESRGRRNYKAAETETKPKRRSPKPGLPYGLVEKSRLETALVIRTRVSKLSTA